MKAAKRLVISCVGDSITEGIGACPMESHSYPAVLQALLGERYEVKNFGASGMTLLREGDYPYVAEPRYAASLQSVPDVVILMMGTNDSKPQNWRFKELYSAQLLALIRQYQQLPTAPRVYVATCATVYRTIDGITDEVVSGDLADRQRQAAALTGCEVIDINRATKGHPDWFCDGVHPNNQGYAELAAIFARILTACYETGREEHDGTKLVL